MQRKHSQIANNHGKVASNHLITYTRAAINWCIKNDFVEGENPWIGIKKYRVKPRERFIKPDEMERFFECLKVLSNEFGIRDYIYLSLFTGARRSNVLAMRWDQINFELGLWAIPHTKNGDSQTIPLTTAAQEILLERLKTRQSDWVFPGSGKTGHLVEPKRTWQNLLDAAEIEDLRLHDLRRTLGSYMAMGNQSLHMIGKVLGHRSADSTQIYSHFAYDPVRQAMEKAHQDMLTYSQQNRQKVDESESPAEEVSANDVHIHSNVYSLDEVRKRKTKK